MTEFDKYFVKIIQNDRSFLQAALIHQNLKLRMTVFKDQNQHEVYTAEITSLDEYQRLKDNCKTLEQVFECMIDCKNVILSLDDYSVSFIYEYGKKVIEAAKVKLQRQDKFEIVSLQSIISRSSFKKELDNDEIKKSFQFLANQIEDFKKQQRQANNRLILRDEILIIVNGEIQRNNLNFEEKMYAKISLLGFETKQEILKIGKYYEDELLKKIIQLEKKAEEKNQQQIIEIKNLKNFQDSFQLDIKSCSKMCDSLTSTTTKINNEIKALSKVLNEKANQLTSLKLGYIENCKIFQKYQSKMKYLDIYITQQKYQSRYQLSKQQKWFSHFIFDGKRLCQTATHGQFSQFVFFEEVPFDYEFIFKIKLVRSHGNVLIGVLDYQKQKEQPRSYNSNNAVSYGTKDGLKYPNRIKHGNGVSQGETVQVRVDKKNNMILWVVNGIERASNELNLLSDKEIKVYPYVELQQNCVIEWSCDMMI